VLNKIWFFLVIISLVTSVFTGKTGAVAQSIGTSSKLAMETALVLTGVMVFWLGLMRIAERAGLVKLLGNMLKPILVRLFPDVPSDHPAMGAMTMNIAANVLGLGNAATPLGIKAMKELQTLNNQKDKATAAMCMFVGINTSSVQLIPATTITILVAAGSTKPTVIVMSTLFATTISTIVAILMAKFYEYKFKRMTKEEYGFNENQ
jgi:spore maturation protein A